jgi:hypothetical protein
MVEADNSGNLKLVIAGLGGTFAIVALVIALQGLYMAYEQHTEEELVVKPPVAELVGVRAQQNTDISTYHTWTEIDPKTKQEKKNIAIPVSRAMELMVAEQKSGGAAKSDKDKKEPANAKK